MISTALPLLSLVALSAAQSSTVSLFLLLGDPQSLVASIAGSVINPHFGNPTLTLTDNGRIPRPQHTSLDVQAKPPVSLQQQPAPAQLISSTQTTSTPLIAVSNQALLSFKVLRLSTSPSVSQMRKFGSLSEGRLNLTICQC